MAAGANSNKRQKNTLAERSARAAGRDPERGPKTMVGGASGKAGKANRGPGVPIGSGAGGGGGAYSKSDVVAVGTSRRPARKRPGQVGRTKKPSR